jgi:hypothetical protein
MTFPSLIAFWLFLWPKNTLSDGRMFRAPLFFSGVFSALAMLFKMTSLFSIGVIPLFLLLAIIKKKRQSEKDEFRDFLCYLIGLSLPYVIAFAFFCYVDSLEHFIYGVFVFNVSYVAQVSWTTALVKVVSFLVNTIHTDGAAFQPLNLLALIAATWVYICEPAVSAQREQRTFIFLLMACSSVGVVVGRNMFEHYFLQMSIPISLLFAYAFSLLTLKFGIASNYLHTALVVVGISLVPFRKIDHLPEAIKAQKNDTLHKVSDYLRKNCSERETIFVLGGQPIVYFLAQRQASTPFFNSLHHYGATGDTLKKGVPARGSFDNNPPTYFVVGEYGGLFPQSLELIRARYRLEETFGEEEYLVYRLIS